MKNIKWLVIAFLSIIVISCKDDSGEYARTFFTDEEMSTALKKCLSVSLDTANSHLAVPGGFSTYDNGKYRVSLPSSANDIVAKLRENNKGDLVDSLESKLNAALEISGNNSKTIFTRAINETVFPIPENIVNGAKNAATSYLRTTKALFLIENMKPLIQANMNSTEALRYWNEVLLAYREYESQPVSIDLVYYATQQMVNHILSEMELEEALIRQNPAHRVSAVLERVFQHQN